MAGGGRRRQRGQCRLPIARHQAQQRRRGDQQARLPAGHLAWGAQAQSRLVRPPEASALGHTMPLGCMQVAGQAVIPYILMHHGACMPAATGSLWRAGVGGGGARVGDGCGLASRSAATAAATATAAACVVNWPMLGIRGIAVPHTRHARHQAPLLTAWMTSSMMLHASP